MWGSVDFIEEIILYYSTCKKQFWVTPKFDKDTKSQGKRCAIGPFKQRSDGKIMYKENYMISFMERWFGEQYSNLPACFFCDDAIDNMCDRHRPFIIDPTILNFNFFFQFISNFQVKFHLPLIGYLELE